MSEMIKVEHEDELLTAECPAFYVMGVGHGHLDGDRITTYTLLANQKLRDEYDARHSKWLYNENIFDVVENFRDEMRRLVVRDYCPGHQCEVEQLWTTPQIFVVTHTKPEK